MQFLWVPPCSIVHTCVSLHPAPSAVSVCGDIRHKMTSYSCNYFFKGNLGVIQCWASAGMVEAASVLLLFSAYFPLQQWNIVCRYRRLSLLKTMKPTALTFLRMVSVYAAENERRHSLEHRERKEKKKAANFLDRLARKHLVIPACRC